MSREPPNALEFQVGAGGDVEERVTVLAVGNLDEWRRRGRGIPSDGRIAFVAFGDLDGDLLTQLSPGIVLSPVLAHEFDCIDLSQLLHSMEFQGPYRAISQDIPKPDMVVREIRQLCPGLEFDILESI